MTNRAPSLTHPSLHTQILIIGGGPSGMISALLANMLGMDVILVEQKHPEHPHGDAHYLNAHTLEILSLVGINMSALHAMATPQDYAMAMAYGQDLTRLFAYVNLWDDPTIQQRYQNTSRFGGALSIPYSLLRPLLIQRMEQANIHVLWRHELTAITLQDKICTLHALATQERVTVHSQYLLGCDGSNSTVRRLLDEKHRPQLWQHFISAKLQGDLTPYVAKKALLYWIYHPSIRACLVAHDLNQHAVLQIPAFPPYETITDYDAPVIHEKMAAICNTSPQSLEIDITDIHPWSMQTFVQPRWHFEWIFLVGDSAHATTPAGGLGLNTAIADAHNLIWKLQANTLNKNDYYLKSYVKERLPVATQNVSYSIDNYKDFTRVPIALGLPPKLGPILPWINQTCQTFLPKKSANSITHLLAQPVALACKRLHKSSVGHTSLNRKIQQCVANNARHFDGMNRHLGFRYRSALIADMPPCHPENSAPDHYHAPIKVGMLLPHVVITTPQSTLALKTLIDYRSWLALLFDEQSQWQHYFTHKPAITTYFMPKNFTITLPTSLDIKHFSQHSLLLVRPDFIVAYWGNHHPGTLTQLDAWLT